MNYPFKFPFALLFGRLGATLTIVIEVCHDDEAGVYIATSKDIPGLVIEAESYSQLKNEVTEAIPNLLSLSNNEKHLKTSADVIYTDHIALG